MVVPAWRGLREMIGMLGDADFVYSYHDKLGPITKTIRDLFLAPTDAQANIILATSLLLSGVFFAVAHYRRPQSSSTRNKKKNPPPTVDELHNLKRQGQTLRDETNQHWGEVYDPALYWKPKLEEWENSVAARVSCIQEGNAGEYFLDMNRSMDRILGPETQKGFDSRFNDSLSRLDDIIDDLKRYDD